MNTCAHWLRSDPARDLVERCSLTPTAATAAAGVDLGMLTENHLERPVQKMATKNGVH